MDHDGFHVEFLDTPLMHKGVDFGYRHLLVHKGNAFFTVLCEGSRLKIQPTYICS